jgi:prostaglandin-E synthase 1
VNDLLMKTLPGLLRDIPGFRLYAFCAVILAIKMYAVGIATAVIRTRRKVILNPEDARQSGVAQATAEHPDVERALRAHRNDMENIPPFLALGLIAVLMGAPLLGMQICFIAFTVARVVHSIVYLKALQPWRSMSFGIGQLASAALG